MLKRNFCELQFRVRERFNEFKPLTTFFFLVEIVNNGDAAVSQIQLAPDATLGAGKLIFLTAKTDDADLDINKVRKSFHKELHF